MSTFGARLWLHRSCSNFSCPPSMNLSTVKRVVPGRPSFLQPEQTCAPDHTYSHAAGFLHAQGEHGDPFYYNIADDTVQWDPPVVLLAGIVAEIEEDDEEEAQTPFKTK
jgi:hypothetical protein